jgi:hypothetical protein
MVFLQGAVPEKNPVPISSIAIQTFGDFFGFHPIDMRVDKTLLFDKRSIR